MVSIVAVSLQAAATDVLQNPGAPNSPTPARPRTQIMASECCAHEVDVSVTYIWLLSRCAHKERPVGGDWFGPEPCWSTPRCTHLRISQRTPDTIVQCARIVRGARSIGRVHRRSMCCGSDTRHNISSICVAAPRTLYMVLYVALDDDHAGFSILCCLRLAWRFTLRED